MHFHAEHTLFFEERKPLWQTVSVLILTVFVLIVNASTTMTISLVGAGLGSILLCIAYLRGHKRVEPAFAWLLVLVVFFEIEGLDFFS